MFKKVLLVVILFSCFTSFAHKDTSYAKMFDKTTSIFITGFLYEEINKGYIMGEYANMLAKELGYKDSLLLIFRHDYTRNYPHFMKLVKHNDFISINYKKSDYSLLETLNLVEYAILTKNKTDSLSDDSLKKIESKNPSELVKKVLSKRIYTGQMKLKIWKMIPAFHIMLKTINITFSTPIPILKDTKI